MAHIEDSFSQGAPISRVPASWFNAVAGFINNLVGGFGVRVERSGRATVVSLDPDAIAQEVSAAASPAEVESLASGGDPTPTAASVDGATFTAGVAGGKGVELFVATRSEEYGELGAIVYRKFTVTSDGRIYAISGEDPSKTQIVYTNGGVGA